MQDRDLILARLQYHASCAPAPDWCVRSSEDPPWYLFERPRDPSPAQGWKLHLSAQTRDGAAVLDRALPLLLEAAVPFKVAASWAALLALNEGQRGLSQIGKFVTIYPRSDDQALELAAALDRATAGLSGPKIPSDRRLHPQSLVHYRYGAFGSRVIQMPWGEIFPALETPNGERIPDRRENAFIDHDWLEDPFVAAGLAGAPRDPEDRIAGRYLPVAKISQGPRGAVFLAVDVQQPRRCVVKESLRFAEGEGERCERLRYEAAMLARLADDPRFPKVLDLCESEQGLALVMEDIQGVTLEVAVRGQATMVKPAPIEALTQWALAIAETVAALHARGIVHRDLKSANVMVSRDGPPRLFDFETACDISSDSSSGATGPRAPALGTRGYMSPQQAAGAPPQLADDIHGFGALLWFMFTASEPGKIPEFRTKLPGLLEVIEPRLSDELAALVTACLASEVADRPPSMAAVAATLRAAGPRRRPVDVRPLDHGDAEPLRALARQVGDSLVAIARPTPEGCMWRSRTGPGRNSFHRDLNSGSAGVVLALAELVDAFADPGHRDALARGAGWLAHSPRPPAAICPGLYVGEAGVGLALLRAGLTLEDEALLEGAQACLRWTAARPLDSPDLFNGAAGRLRAHLAAAVVLDDEQHRSEARRLGAWLLAQAEPGGGRWRMPANFGGLSGAIQPGYAHGAAGIADALLDLHTLEPDDGLATAVRETVRWLSAQALPTLEDDRGLDWPAREDGGNQGRIGPFWCHGAAGVARFLLRAHAAGVSEAGPLAQRALLSVGRGARASVISQCHGLLGNLEVLIDGYQASADPQLLLEARPLLQLILAHATRVDDRLVWPCDRAEDFTPDLMTGVAGVAPCLLRAADFADRPHFASLRGLTRRPNQPLVGAPHRGQPRQP